MQRISQQSSHVHQGAVMTEIPRSQSFWTTAPGVLTAVAAVITAVGGLIAILFQTGIIGGTAPASPPANQVRLPNTTENTATSTSSMATSAAGKPWRDVAAVFTATDGTQTPMPADTVRFCISAGTGINLNDSQDIAFDKMTRIDVLRSDVALSSGGKATLRVNLVNGSTMEGTITSGCDFFGQTDIGRYSLYPDKLASIAFRR